MRRLLFERGIIQPQVFEARVREMAIRSQDREGIRDPYNEEDSNIWDIRIKNVRDQLTDLIFSHQVSYDEFEKITNEVLSERGVGQQDHLLSVNPELAPQEIVFEQAMMFEKLSPEDRVKYEARMQEAKVVLIRNLISDQLQYINIAKEWFSLGDLLEIRKRKIGAGKIGGKAAGMLLAHRVLADTEEFQHSTCMSPPESYYIGSNEIYTFMTINDLTHWNDQKYKSEEEMRAEYPAIVREFQTGEFPPDILDKLVAILEKVEKQPMMLEFQQAYEFPCSLSIKAIGDDYDDYLQFVMDTVLDIIGTIEVAEVTSRKSAGDKYLAVTIPFIAETREQLEAVYVAINQDQRTRFVI